MKQNKTKTFDSKYSFWAKAIEISIVGIIFLVPIAFYPRCVTVFLPIKELLAEALILIGLMFWAFKMISREELKFSPSPLNLPLLSFISIILLSMVWSNNFIVSLKELPLFLSGPLLYFIIVNNINKDKQINLFVNSLLIIGGLFGIYGIFQYNGIDLPYWAGNVERQQVFGLFGNVNYFAEFLIIPLPIALSLFFVTKNKLGKSLLLISIFAMGTSLILTFTRGSYLAMGISSIFIFSLFLTIRGRMALQKNKKIIILAIVAIIMVLTLFIIPTPLNSEDTVIYKIKSRIQISELIGGVASKRRIANWASTIMMIKDHPLLGSGIGTYKYNILSYQAEFFDRGENRTIYPYGFPDKAHNEYLQLWAELGIVGLIIFLWLMFTYFNYGIKYLKREKDKQKQGIIIGLMGTVAAVLVDAIFEFPLHLPTNVVLFWLIIGLSVSMINKEISTEDEKGKKLTLRFKPLLYIAIIFLTVFLCVTVARPFMARTYWYQGNMEGKKENFQGAIDAYEKSLKWDPYFGRIYYNMGKVLLHGKAYKPALEYLKKAEKYVDLPELPSALALCYINEGILDKAEIMLKKAISYRKDDEPVIPYYADLGKIYMNTKKYELAEEFFQNILKVEPDSIDGRVFLGGLYVFQKRFKEALKEFQEITALAPNTTDSEKAEMMIKSIEAQLEKDNAKGE